MSAITFEAALGPARQAQLGRGTIEYHERGEGRPLVFLHGAAVHAGFWRKVVPPLAESYRCIAPTLPLGGHRIPMPRDADLRPTGLADLVADFLEALDCEDAVVVGNDTGGAIAQILVTRRPERVGGLVLTPSDAFKTFLPWQFRALQVAARIPGATWQTAQILRMPAARRSPLGFGLLTKKGIDDEVSASYFHSLPRNAGVRRDVTKFLKGIRVRYTMEAARLLPGFEHPALIAWASEDRVFPVSDARRLASLLPDARLELIDDSWAYVPEDQPERLVALMSDFLAGDRARSGKLHA